MAFCGRREAVTRETVLCSSHTNLATYFYGKLEAITMFFGKKKKSREGKETETAFPRKQAGSRIVHRAAKALQSGGK